MQFDCRLGPQLLTDLNEILKSKHVANRTICPVFHYIQMFYYILKDCFVLNAAE